ncbi:MAG: fumarylacetoacetate hydrolase family protein [Anaerolineales bacterium]|nr:fumarylacetoacetate hydrolase family protein [Anaerolineales bacterium]
MSHANMRLVTFHHDRRERIGVQLESDILDLSRIGMPMDMKTFLSLGETALVQTHEALASVKEEWLLPESAVTLRAPVPRPDKVLCVGYNYAGHTEKGRAELPQYPNLFCKTVNTVIGPNQPIVIPPATTQADYEAELMAVIGKRAYQVSESEAQSCIAGYTIFNDVSARDYRKRTSQLMLGKSFDTFGPMGPALVTPDEVPDPYNLEMELTVNGVPGQRVNTCDMIFSVLYLISYLSQVMTLEAGDVIATGTPTKLPEAAEQKRFLQPGDVIEITIEKLGTLKNMVVNGNSVNHRFSL